MFGLNIVYDAGGGALHVLGDVAAELIGAWSEESMAFDDVKRRGIEAEYGVPETREAAEEIEALVADGQLFTTDKIEPETSVPAGADAAVGANIFKSLCVHLSHDCNMRCAYCFASGGSFGHERELMSYGTARAAIDFIAEASADRKNIEIDFFGGEPLLNFDVLKRAVEYAKNVGEKRGKTFRFTLTTNGSLLDAAAVEYINANMDNLVLSLDGRKEINDAVRLFPDGAGTYDRVVANIKAVTERREASWYVRGTYTANNMDFSNDVLHLADLGFDRLSVEPVVTPFEPGLAFSPEDAAALCDEYEKLAYAMYERSRKGRPLDFFHFNIDLDAGPCLARRIKGCGAGHEYAAVTPGGDLYPCHQLVGVERFLLGNVREGIINQEVADLFKRSNLYKKDECARCWAKYFCGGGCAANAWFYNGDIDKPNAFYCELFRKRIECALWLKCAAYAPRLRRVY